MAANTQNDLIRKKGSTFVRDPRTGELYELKGFGSKRGGSMLDRINPNIDLTKPIWEQIYGEGAEKQKKSRTNRRKTAA